MKLEEGVALAKLTTIGTGGPARAFAKPSTFAELERALAWAAERDLSVATVGLGSNLLAADEGVDALVLRLGGELASVRVRGDILIAGGGATNAVCLHQARAAGLGGFEFACAIPGTAGGGVRMNAGAYGSDWSDILLRAKVVTAQGAVWFEPAGLGLSYRHSALPENGGSRRGHVPADAAATAGDQVHGRRADCAAQGDPADEQANVRQRLQEPRPRARRGPDARGQRPEGTPDRRRRDLADSTPTSSRTRAARPPRTRWR